MKVVVKNVGKEPKVVEIDGKLKTMQDIVGGYIQTFPWFDRIIIVCNEEGKLMDLPENFKVRCSPSYVETIVGNVFFCKAGDEDFESLTDEEIKIIIDDFERIEKALNNTM